MAQQSNGQDKRQRVGISDAALQLIDRDLVGKIGDKRGDVLQYIIVSWLSEKGYFDRRGP